MANFVLISEAVQHCQYTPDHLRYLARKGFVSSKRVGGIWFIDLDDLIRYEQEMEQLGPKRFGPKSDKPTE